MNLFQFILLLFMISCTSSVSKSSDFNVTSYREKDLQVLKSKIPGAGKGVFVQV